MIPKDDYGYSKYVMSEYLGVRESSNKPGIIYNPIIFGLYGQGRRLHVQIHLQCDHEESVRDADRH